MEDAAVYPCSHWEFTLKGSPVHHFAHAHIWGTLQNPMSVLPDYLEKIFIQYINLQRGHSWNHWNHCKTVKPAIIML